MKEIYTALCKAQSQFKPAVFDCVNPYFTSKYASLTSVIESIRKPLADNGLSISQSVILNAEKEMEMVTSLMHISGEVIVGHTPVLMAKKDMQSLGSAITYAKRYGISALLGVVTDSDDDGNEASKPQPQKPVASKVEVKKVTQPAATIAPVIKEVVKEIAAKGEEKINETHFKELLTVCGELNIDYKKQVLPIMKELFKKESHRDLTVKECFELIDRVQLSFQIPLFK